MSIPPYVRAVSRSAHRSGPLLDRHPYPSSEYCTPTRFPKARQAVSFYPKLLNCYQISSKFIDG